MEGLDVVERFFEDHEFVGLAEFFPHLIPRVIRVRGADHDLHLGIDLPDARGGFDAIPARRHPDVHERHRVGPALGHRAPDHLEAFLALVGRVQLEADGLALVGRLAKQGRFHGAGPVGCALAGEDLLKIAVNGAIVVDDKDAAVLLSRLSFHWRKSPVYRAAPRQTWRHGPGRRSAR